MITNKKIEELYESTPDYVGVGFGFKLTNKEYTEDHAVIFTVEKNVLLKKYLKTNYFLAKLKLMVLFIKLMLLK